MTVHVLRMIYIYQFTLKPLAITTEAKVIRVLTLQNNILSKISKTRFALDV